MSDVPKCVKCGADKVPMKNSRGQWYVGCAVCKGSPAPKSTGDPKPKPKEEPKKRSWVDDWI